jgi:formylglycine-generating enzyme required for sulfatase activity
VNVSTLRWAALGLLLACNDAPEEPGATTESLGAERGEAEAAEPESEGCSARMALLPTGACMDRHEAQVENGRAISAEGQLPSNGLSFNDAASACAAAGFRLCTRSEWNAACGGNEHNDYPYGAEYEQERCNSAADGTDVSSRALAPSGSFERCVSPLGLHDLSGNAVEWIDAADGTGTLRELRGGSFATYPAKSTCEFEHNAFQPPEAAYDGQGFRCCSDG